MGRGRGSDGTAKAKAKCRSFRRVAASVCSIFFSIFFFGDVGSDGREGEEQAGMGRESSGI